MATPAIQLHRWSHLEYDRMIASGVFHPEARLELSGMVKVTHAKPEPGKAWQIERIERTALGDAKLHLLQEEELFLYLMLYAEFEDEISSRSRKRLKQFFPEWKRDLVLPEQERKKGVYVFKVSLCSVWARIAIPSGNTLDKLSSCILNAFAFDFDHLYQFSYKNRFGISTHIKHPYMEETPSGVRGHYWRYRPNPWVYDGLPV